MEQQIAQKFGVDTGDIEIDEIADGEVYGHVENHAVTWKGKEYHYCEFRFDCTALTLIVEFHHKEDQAEPDHKESFGPALMFPPTNNKRTAQPTEEEPAAKRHQADDEKKCCGAAYKSTRCRACDDLCCEHCWESHQTGDEGEVYICKACQTKGYYGVAECKKRCFGDNELGRLDTFGEWECAKCKTMYCPNCMAECRLGDAYVCEPCFVQHHVLDGLHV